MAKHALDQVTTVLLADKLRAVCTSHGGYARYVEEWSDEKVAKELGVMLSNVSGMRERLLGRLRKDKPPTVEERLAEAERVITALTMWAAMRHKGPFKLEEE